MLPLEGVLCFSWNWRKAPFELVTHTITEADQCLRNASNIPPRKMKIRPCLSLVQPVETRYIASLPHQHWPHYNGSLSKRPTPRIWPISVANPGSAAPTASAPSQLAHSRSRTGGCSPGHLYQYRRFAGRERQEHPPSGTGGLTSRPP